MKSNIWCFVGIDGSGKTTQAKMLLNYFYSRNVSASYVWVRWDPLLLKPLFIIFKRLLLKRSKIENVTITSKEYKELKNFKQKALKSGLMKTAWFILALLDYYLQVLIKIFPKLVIGKTIVCDRYYYDFLADQLLNLNLTNKMKTTLYCSLQKFFPEPRKVFYIFIEPEESLKRKQDIPGLEYASDREKMYSLFAQLNKSWKIIDGAKAKEDIHKDIISFLES